jgi:hypothetical protein
MSKEWIESLAQEIKQAHHEAAEKYGRDQHYAGIVSTAGKDFFMLHVRCLQENVDAIRHQLQGDSTAAEMAVDTVRADEIHISRARFPCVDARLTHHEDRITLDYIKDPGIQGDPKLDRTTRTYAFQVGADDILYVQDAFADQPGRYEKPEELARHITELLFSV